MTARADAFRLWLREHYGTPEALSAAWRRAVTSFDDVQPPEPAAARSRDDLPPLVDLLTFEDETAPEDRPGALAYLAEALAGDDAPPTPQLYRRVQIAAREVTADGRPRSAREVCRLAGASGAALPFAARAALMHGASAAELPELPAGALPPELTDTLAAEPWQVDHKLLILYPRLVERLQRLMRRQAPAARDGATLDCDPPPGLERPLHVEGPLLTKKYLDLAARARFPWAIADTTLPLEVLQAFPLVICPTLEVLSAAAMRTLDAYVHRGGFLALGPRVPLMDETMQQNATLARHFPGGLSELPLSLRHIGEGGLLTLPGPVSHETIAFLGFESGIARGLVCDSSALDVSVHRAGGRRLVWIANPTDRSATTALSGEPVGGLRSIEGGRPPDGGRLTVPARTVVVLEVL